MRPAQKPPPPTAKLLEPKLGPKLRANSKRRLSRPGPRQKKEASAAGQSCRPLPFCVGIYRFALHFGNVNFIVSLARWGYSHISAFHCLVGFIHSVVMRLQKQLLDIAKLVV